MGHRRSVAQTRNGRNRRVRAEIQKDAFGRDRPLSTIVESHRQRLWPCEPRRPHDQCSAGRFVLVHMNRDQRLHHLPLAPSHAFHINRDRSRHRPEILRMTRKVRDLGAPYLVLCPKAVHVGARSTNPPPLDDHGLLARLRQVPREIFSALASADNYILTMFSVHKDLPKPVGRTPTEHNARTRLTILARGFPTRRFPARPSSTLNRPQPLPVRSRPLPPSTP